MSERLLESDFLIVNLKNVLNPQAVETAAQDNTPVPNTPVSANVADDILAQQLEALAFTPEIITKLLALGDHFKTACRILGVSERNPIIAFVKQQSVQKTLLNTNLLNINTFKAIYNAVAKNLVASSEFATTNNYNLIYCPDLYRKSVKEMEDYLTLQSKLLKPSASQYDAKTQLLNRKVFLNIDSIQETDLEARAKAIKNITDINTIPVVAQAKLNSIELIKKISGVRSTSNADAPAQLNNDKLSEIAEKLDSLPMQLAALLSLKISSNSAEAEKALNDPEAKARFDSVDDASLGQAFINLAKNNILPKGKLSDESARVLVAVILAQVGPNKENQ